MVPTVFAPLSRTTLPESPPRKRAVASTAFGSPGVFQLLAVDQLLPKFPLQVLSLPATATATVPRLLRKMGPLIEPVPLSVPVPLTMTVDPPVAEPEVLFTASVPPLIWVAPV